MPLAGSHAELPGTLGPLPAPLLLSLGPGSISLQPAWAVPPGEVQLAFGASLPQAPCATPLGSSRFGQPQQPAPPVPKATSFGESFPTLSRSAFQASLVLPGEVSCPTFERWWVEPGDTARHPTEPWTAPTRSDLDPGVRSGGGEAGSPENKPVNVYSHCCRRARKGTIAVLWR